MIYDCFPFFNELDLLEVRLTELNRIVDQFVLVESPLTFSGKDKPLYFAENKERFERYESKIRHIVLKDPIVGEGKEWQRDHQQRNYMIHGIGDAKDNDLVICSDLDEIVNSMCFDAIDYCLRKFTHGERPIHLSMKAYYFYFNLKWWLNQHDAIVAPAHLFRRTPANDLRYAPLLNGEIVPDAGWHFTYLGGREKVIQKCESFAHCNESGNLDQIRQMKEGVEPVIIDKERVRMVLVDDSFPGAVFNNYNRWKKAGYIFE